MLENLHHIASRMRHARFLAGQDWLWEWVEPYFQRTFQKMSKRQGFSTLVNGDRFNLIYRYAMTFTKQLSTHAPTLPRKETEILQPSCGASTRPYDLRVYEPSFYSAFVREIVEGMQVFDIGAHIGLFTLGAAKRVGGHGRVYAFEPSPEAAEILEQHVRLNGWQDRVEVVRAVVSDINAVVPFYAQGVNMAASLSRANVEPWQHTSPDTPVVSLEIPSVTLDQFCQERGIKPDLLKIDVEGSELFVLRGANNLLSATQVSILCEVHPRQMQNCGASLAEFEVYLSSLGYRCKPLDEPNAQGIFHSLISRGA